MEVENQEIVVQDIDHLGIVAGIIDKMDLVGLIDTLIPPHQLEIVTTGMAVKAIILNCMGFLTSPFYLFDKFFEDKPVEHLFGKNIQSKHLNESRLGRGASQLCSKRELSAQFTETLQNSPSFQKMLNEANTLYQRFIERCS